jgi:membrane-bound lytic murein transglycosylase B
MSTEHGIGGRRWLPWAAVTLLVVVVAGLVTGDLLLLHTTRRFDATTTALSVPAQPGAVPTQITGTAGDPVDISDWANRLASATGIPAVAMAAYGQAQLTLAASEPACHLSWNTLAGIAAVESDNGRYGGAWVTSQGKETVPIIGVRLNGSPGNQTVLDTDHGVLDGDPVYDHAVGPFQFLPATWRRFAAPGSDPQNIGAAALAAGRYLCASGRDLSRATDWQAAVLAYNDSADYVSLVLRFADEYGRADPAG